MVVGSRLAIRTSDWEPGHKSGRPGSALSRAALDDLGRKCKGRILTDDDAPVENLLLPVVNTRK